MAKSLEALEAEVKDLRLQLDTLLKLLSEKVPGVTSAQFKRQLEEARERARLDAADLALSGPIQK